MKEKYLWYTIEISIDESPMDPRENDNMCTMKCNHWRYNLGDGKLDSNWESFEDDLLRELYPDEMEEVDEWNMELEDIERLLDNEYIYEPLSLYDHSWISISIWKKSWWDSGQIWYIYCHRDRIKEWLNLDKLTTSDLDRAKEILKSEVESYDKYLTWEIYDSTIEELDEYCWWYESEEEALEDAKYYIDLTDKNWKLISKAEYIYNKAMENFWDTVNNNVNEYDKEFIENIISKKIN